MLSAVEDLIAEFIGNVGQFLAAVAIFVAALVLSRAVERWATRSVRKKIEDAETRRFLARSARYAVLVLGILAALEQIPGIEVTSFLAGLGILGFTIGFALQDIARNFVAGLLLLLGQPFKVGDAVEIAGHAGSVMDITMRDTVIKTWDGVMEIIPNLDVYTSPIVNYTELPLRRRTVMIGLGYGEDVDQARAIILNAIQSTEGVLEEPAPEIITKELGDATLNMAARFWVNQQTHNLFTVHSDVVEAINAVAERESIDMPYPIQIVQLEAELPFETPFS
ncbi:MAG: mechanosensitive ion channel [Chloroflexota bacterium]|nr:mechanosensitive ion channel [Chloroflexota bacterium]